MSRSRGAIVLLVALSGVHTIGAAPQSPYDSRRAMAPAIEASIEQTFQRYASGDDLAVRRWFQAGEGVVGMPFIEAFMARRRETWNHMTAMFVLEAVVWNPDRQVFRGPPLLSLGRAMIVTPAAANRPTPASAFELLWHQTAMAVAQGMRQYAVQQEYLDAVATRFEEAEVRGLAGESRLPLARAIAASGLCCWRPVAGAVIQRAIPGPRRSLSLDDALRLFTRAAEHPWLASESLIRSGVALQSAGRSAEAVAWFARVPPDADPALGYVHHLNYARALEMTGQTAGAAAEYAAAVGFAPAGQIASIGLAASLLRLGRTEEANRRATEARRLPAETVDHVAQFERADARFIPIWLAELRKLRAS